MRLLGWTALGLALYALLDVILAFSPRWRLGLNLALGLSLAGMALARGLGIVAFSRREAARRADTAIGTRRQPVLSALELHADANDRQPGDLHRFLVDRSIGQALHAIRQIPATHQVPLRALRKQARALALQLLAVMLLLAVNPPAMWTALNRIASPHRDIPPYSRLAFTVHPASPVVVYGGDLSLSVSIEGAPVKEQVWFITRAEGRIHRTACFQESGQVFAQRLERVVAPISFCFSTGKARSPWYDVSLRLQPEIALAGMTIRPPAYTGWPARSFLIGREPIQALAGSHLTLALTSNRPLLDGSLALQATHDDTATSTVAGVRKDSHTVVFEWTLQQTARLEAVVRDIRGTRNRTPFQALQHLTPDAPPSVTITQPAGFAIATPKTKLPFVCDATDDVGLRRVELIRTVVGYRDRVQGLGPRAPTRDLQHDTMLDLGLLGTEPGQILEFYLEASDVNPRLTGFAASDVTRVQIISEDDYAAMLRVQTGIDEFLARFSAVEAQMKELREALEALRDAARDTPEDTAAIEEALQRARDENREAGELFQKLANDFEAYDLEKALTSALAQTTEPLGQQAQALAAARPGQPGLAAQVTEMLESLGQQEEQIAAQTADAQETALVGRLMQEASRFQQLVQRQTDLVRRLERYAEGGAGGSTRLLGALGKEQDGIRADLETFTRDVATHANALPAKYRDLAASAREFLAAMKPLEIPALMTDAAEAARNEAGREAHRSATLALERMGQLMSDCSGGSFGGMCQGDMRFQVPKNLQTTMQQMLSAIGMRLGRGGSGNGMGAGAGAGTGMGMGMGGGAGDGYWMRGRSPLNVPTYGPPRTRFANPAGSGTGGVGPDAGGRSPTGQRVHESENLEGSGTGDINSDSLPLEQIPPKYREAVKRYFEESE